MLTDSVNTCVFYSKKLIKKKMQPLKPRYGVTMASNVE